MNIHEMTPEKWAKIDCFWLRVAISFGETFSKDPKYKFGCILLNNRTLAPVMGGYNGRGAGRPDVRISMEQGKAGTAHSEANAVGRMNWDWSCTYTAYVRSTPCYDCASLILNVPISRYVHMDIYEPERGDLELQGSGRVEVIQLNPYLPQHFVQLSTSEYYALLRDRAGYGVAIEMARLYEEAYNARLQGDTTTEITAITKLRAAERLERSGK